MFYAFRTLSTLVGTGQPRTRTSSGRAVTALLAALLLASACHPMPRPGDADPRLPRAFRTPQATFHTWMAATRAGDRSALTACFWSGLSGAELDAWLAGNLREETRAGFAGARWDGFQPVSAVEGVFRFTAKNGTEFRGVMVRTAKGWKIQSF